PIRRASAEGPASRSAAQSFRLGGDLTRTLKDLAQAQGATPFVLLLAAYQVLLHRYSGQHDVLTGTLAAGRSRAESARTVGYFPTPVVVRAALSAGPSFRAFLQQVRATMLEAFDHQDLPLAVLTARLQRSHGARRPLIFQATFAWHQPQACG